MLIRVAYIKAYSAVASGIGILSKSVFRKRQKKHSNIAATASHFPKMPNGTSCQICQLMYAALAETPTKSSPIIHVKFIRTIFCSFVFICSSKGTYFCCYTKLNINVVGS